MSSMIKKKGNLSFKPKAPQSRRQPRAPPSAPSSTRQSIERQSQTPAPPATQSTALSPQILSRHSELLAPDLSSYNKEVIVDEHAVTSYPRSNILSEASTEADKGETLVASSTEEDRYLTGDTTQSINLVNRPANDGDDSVSLGEAPDEDPVVRPVQPPAVGLDPSLITCLASETTPTSPVIQEAQVVSHPTSETTESQPSAVQVLAEPTSLDISIFGPGESPQASAVIHTATLSADGSSGVFRPRGSRGKARRPSKRRKLNADGDADVRPSIEVQIHKPRRVTRRKPADGGKSRKKRSVTPDDAEEQAVDHSNMKMGDLTKDLRIGRKFSRHAEIKQREVNRKIKAKMARLHPELIVEQTGEDANPSQVGEGEETAVEATTGPQMRIVNGQIVIDDSSLVVDRHAMAAAAAETMEEVEEDDFTRITTSGTYMKRERYIGWDFEANEKFYNALRMFGTDFEIIAKMFPDRTRRQIKLKFLKESREYPQKITKALIGEPVTIDFEEYKTHTGLEYEEVADIEAEHARIEEEHNEEQRRMEAELEEATRQKKAEIHERAPTATAAASASTTASGTRATYAQSPAREAEAEASGADLGEKSSAASKSKKKSAVKKKKRNLHSVRGGGEEVEVLGTLA